MTVKMHVLGY